MASGILHLNTNFRGKGPPGSSCCGHTRTCVNKRNDFSFSFETRATSLRHLQQMPILAVLKEHPVQCNVCSSLVISLCVSQPAGCSVPAQERLCWALWLWEQPGTPSKPTIWLEQVGSEEGPSPAHRIVHALQHTRSITALVWRSWVHITATKANFTSELDFLLLPLRDQDFSRFPSP